MIPGIIAGQLAGISPPPALNISGVYSDIFISNNIPVPSGAQVGDLLVIFITRGSTDITAPPAGFTTVYQTVAGTIATKTLQANDTKFSIASSSYVTLVSIKRAIGTASIDAVSAVNTYTSNQTFITPVATPTETGDLALMVFLSSNNAMKTPQPAYNNLIPYNRTGAGGCGMAISSTLLPTASPFNGTSCGGSASSGFQGAALTILFK